MSSSRGTRHPQTLVEALTPENNNIFALGTEAKELHQEVSRHKKMDDAVRASFNSHGKKLATAVTKEIVSFETSLADA